MDDSRIIELYEARDEQAIRETSDIIRRLYPQNRRQYSRKPRRHGGVCKRSALPCLEYDSAEAAENTFRVSRADHEGGFDRRIPEKPSEETGGLGFSASSGTREDLEKHINSMEVWITED